MNTTGERENQEMMELARAIRDVRHGLGFTQEGFGAIVGVDGETVHRWEIGANRPSKTAQRKLMKAVSGLGADAGSKLGAAFGPPGMHGETAALDAGACVTRLMGVDARYVESGMFSGSIVANAYRRLTLGACAETVMVLSTERLELREGKTPKDLADAMTALGYSELARNRSRVLFLRPGLGEITVTPGGISLTAVRSDAMRIVDMLKQHVIRVAYERPEPEAGTIYSLSLYHSGGASHLKLNAVGQVGSRLVRENYSPRVLEQYDVVCEQLQADTPRARLTLIEGAPGTGKTYMIRSLAHECQGAVLTMVFPDVLPTLTNPELLHSLVNIASDSDGKLVFVIEDGDSLVVKRKGETLSRIAAVLNLTDGMLGAALDLRMIVTTNARKDDLDPAIVRKRRLLERIEITSLPLLSAHAALKSLVPGAALPSHWAGPVPICDVYDAAWNAGWRPDKPTSGDEPQAKPRELIERYDFEDLMDGEPE